MPSLAPLPKSACPQPSWLTILATWLILSMAMPLTASEALPTLHDLALLVDPQGTETITSIAQADAGRFTPLPGNGFTQGYTRATHWLRFTLDAPPGEWWLDLLPPYLDDLRLYAPDPTQPGRFIERRAGDRLPFAAREVPYRGFVFKLQQPDDQPRTYYLRLTTTSSSILVPRIWSPDGFLAMASREAALLAASLTVLLTLLLLSLNNWLWLRDPLLPWFMACIGSLALATASSVSGFVFQYLLPTHPAIADPLVGVSALLAFALGTGFFRRLFEIDRQRPWLNGLYLLGFWLPLTATPLAAVGYLPEVMPLALNLMLLIDVCNLFLAIGLWRRRDAGAGFMFAANLISLLGILIMILNLLGVINGGFPALYSIQVSSLGTGLALHLALGGRFRALRDAQRQAIAEAARERRIQEEQGRFIDLISHEFRTPLAVLQTNLDILAMTARSSQGEEIRGMRHALERLRDLFISARRNRAWEKTHSLQTQPIAPAPLLRHLLDQQAATDPTHAYRHALASAQPCAILGDASLLRTILGNLLENAEKYATPGTTVEVGLENNDHAVILTIDNDYPAQAKLVSDQLLQSHTRGANSAGRPGLGMGLYLTQRLAADMGGALNLDLKQPGRFRVTLTFPRSEGRLAS